MIFPSCQTVKITCLDEISYVVAFLLLTLINKNELEGKWNSSPCTFVSWQALFSLVICSCLLLHSKIRNEVKILDKANFLLILPVGINHTFLLLTGAIALTILPVPICFAWSNLCPAILILIARKNKNFKNPLTLGLATVFLSVILILIVNSTGLDRFVYLILVMHVVINVLHSLYIKRIKIEITDFSLIFYINLINFIIIFPYGVYSAIETFPELSQIVPCLFSGFNCLVIEILAFRLKAKYRRILIVQGVAQFLSILASFYLFDNPPDLITWGLIGINCFTTGFILKFIDDSIKSHQYILVVPHMSKNIYIERYINYKDMA